MESRRILFSILRITIATTVLLLLILMSVAVVIRQPNVGQLLFPDGARANPETLRKHVEFLTKDVFPRNTRHPENLDRAADYIMEAISLPGALVSEQEYHADGVGCRNIIARFGSNQGKLLVVGAHYDAYGDLPGADDNASGVAGLLELARLLSERNYDLPIELVAYSTEEPPFFGSREMGSAVHAQSLRARNAEVLGMICLEMIGYFSDHQMTNSVLLRLIYPSTGDFIIVAGRWGDRSLAKSVKKSFRGATDVRVFTYSGPVVIGTDLSDHRNYWIEGYPAVMITDTAYLRNPNYHTSSDTADTLDYQCMAGVVDGVLSAVWHLQIND